MGMSQGVPCDPLKNARCLGILIEKSLRENTFLQFYVNLWKSHTFWDLGYFKWKMTYITPNPRESRGYNTAQLWCATHAGSKGISYRDIWCCMMISH